MLPAFVACAAPLMSSYSNNHFSGRSNSANPTITQCTAALPRASLFHWKVRWAKFMRTPCARRNGQKMPACSPWVMELVETSAASIDRLACINSAAFTYQLVTKSNTPRAGISRKTWAWSIFWPAPW